MATYKQFLYDNLNNGHLFHLVAADMFDDKTKLIFDAKTGKHIGYVREGQLVELKPEIAEELEQDFYNKQQLSLF